MHKPEYILVNKTLKILWDFDLQTNHLILARRLDCDSWQKREPAVWWSLPSGGPLGVNESKKKEMIST